MKQSDTTQALASLKLTAAVLSVETHEVAAQAYFLLHAQSPVAFLNVNALRRQIDRLKEGIASMDAALLIVERDMGVQHKAEAA